MRPMLKRLMQINKAIDKVRNGLVEEEELIEKDVIIDGMYLQSKSS